MSLDLSVAKSFAISGSFSGGYSQIMGNFDKQGISFGFMQWSLGEGNLQTLLSEFYETHEQVFHECCTVYVPLYERAIDLTDSIMELSALAPIQAVAKSITHQNKQFILYPHWMQAFKNLGEAEEFQQIQRKRMETLVERAKQYCSDYNLRTERSLALFIDTCVQQDMIKDVTKDRINADGFKNATSIDRKLELVAESVSRQARDIWQREVLARRMCIVKFGGVVNGRVYDLKKEYNLTDDIII